MEKWYQVKEIRIKQFGEKRTACVVRFSNQSFAEEVFDALISGTKFSEDCNNHIAVIERLRQRCKHNDKYDENGEVSTIIFQDEFCNFMFILLILSDSFGACAEMIDRYEKIIDELHKIIDRYEKMIDELRTAG